VAPGGGAYDERAGVMAGKMAIRENIFLIAAVISIFANVSQYIVNNKAQASADLVLASKQQELNKEREDKSALENMSVPGFLRQYDAHVAELKSAADAYDKAKSAKGSNIIGSDMTASWHTQKMN
jgi:hypothetical protein